VAAPDRCRARGDIDSPPSGAVPRSLGSQETGEAIMWEWEALDWRTQLEEHTKAVSYQFASKRFELDQEREDLKEDLEKVFDREREVTRKEKSLVQKKEHLDQREAVITETL
jgi:hypothetical protein